MGSSPEKAESVATGTALEGIVMSAVVQAWWFGTSWFVTIGAQQLLSRVSP